MLIKKKKIFFLNLDYYLATEIPSALNSLNIPFLDFRPNKLGLEGDKFLPQAMEAVLRYKPDFVLTVNALGLDWEGQMAHFFNKIKIPFVVWFLDSPELFLHGYEHIYPDNSIFFSCDPYAACKTRNSIAKSIHYLPLAVDINNMKEIGTGRIPVSFVGETWTNKIAACHKKYNFSRYFLLQAPIVAKAMATAKPVSGIDFLQNKFPDFYLAANDLSPRLRNGLWHLVYWQANKIYRKQCINKILNFKPIIAGDKYWKNILKNEIFDYHPPIAYGEELFKLYFFSKINFACSSMQMSGAVTQRVFDVPAAGSFIITDRRKQLEDIFEVDKEVVCYSELEQIPELINRYLVDDKQRIKVVKAARRKIASKHTYQHRLQHLINILIQS